MNNLRPTFLAHSVYSRLLLTYQKYSVVIVNIESLLVHRRTCLGVHHSMFATFR